MIRKSLHGELLLEQLQTPGKRPWSIISYKEDVLGKQISIAQKAGAKAVVVAQTRVDPDPTRGDIENELLFQSGYDGARQKSYQFVQDPEVVSTLLLKEITHISCGEEHSAAVSSDGALYCWGSGRDGKLGTGSLDDEDAPVAIDSLSSVKVARVECGSSQTLVVTQNPSLLSKQVST
ncbi:E3 ubiquitin-protein ligase HERC2 [Phytophthora cinnamomi]|uniref:E3 ubiquitin-protein ligase HERC2 n=1 Tax=Phytophthora cinnamomi TaxID=4785 RepID=UPI0035595ED9|nr:E3 ubiquitin-protein ligase HERC2 [Phytophthora cinnamomi]